MFSIRIIQLCVVYCLLLTGLFACSTNERPPVTTPTQFYIAEDEVIKLKKIGEKGDIDAMDRLIGFYRFYKPDYNNLLYWLEKSSSYGNNQAKVALAQLHFHKNTKESIEIANKLLEEAAPELPFAVYALGSSYEEGRGYEKSNIKACEMYMKAMRLGEAIAKGAVSRLNCK